MTLSPHLSIGIIPGTKGEALTVREVTEALYAFLERLDVPATLKKWSQKAQEEGDLSEARLHEQIWEAVHSSLG